MQPIKIPCKIWTLVSRLLDAVVFLSATTSVFTIGVQCTMYQLHRLPFSIGLLSLLLVQNLVNAQVNLLVSHDRFIDPL